VCATDEYTLSPCTATADAQCRRLSVCDAATQFQERAAGPTTDRVCQDARQCLAGEYALFLLTATSDRVCQPLTVCAPGKEYIFTPATRTTDRVCAPLTRCAAHQYEAAPPASALDRVCRDLTVCGQDEYEFIAPSATSDRLCEPYRACNGPEEYEEAAATPTSDAVCRPATRCGSVGQQYEARSLSRSQDRLCMAVTPPCAPNAAYEAAAPTVTSDRVCVAATVCDPAVNTQFAATDTLYESAPLTATTDRTCSRVTVCVGASATTGREYEAAPPTATSDRVCRGVTTCRQGRPVSLLRVCAACDTAVRGELPVSGACISAVLDPSVCRVDDDDAGTTPQEPLVDTPYCQPCTDGGVSFNSFDGPCMSVLKQWLDRVCRDDPFQDYQVASPTATSDRVCQPVTVCDASAVESEPATATTDRVCAAVADDAIGSAGETDKSSGAGTEGWIVAVIVVAALIIIVGLWVVYRRSTYSGRVDPDPVVSIQARGSGTFDDYRYGGLGSGDGDGGNELELTAAPAYYDEAFTSFSIADARPRGAGLDSGSLTGSITDIQSTYLGAQVRRGPRVAPLVTDYAFPGMPACVPSRNCHASTVYSVLWLRPKQRPTPFTCAGQASSAHVLSQSYLVVLRVQTKPQQLPPNIINCHRT